MLPKFVSIYCVNVGYTLSDVAAWLWYDNRSNNLMNIDVFLDIVAFSHWIVPDMHKEMKTHSFCIQHRKALHCKLHGLTKKHPLQESG